MAKIGNVPTSGVNTPDSAPKPAKKAAKKSTTSTKKGGSTKAP